VRRKQGAKNKPPHRYSLPFLAWDRQNYSCAYDSLLTPLYATWVAMTDSNQARLQLTSNALQRIAQDFSMTQRAPPQDQGRLLFQTRENLRDWLSNVPESARFPRFGPALISLDELFEKVGLSARLEFTVHLSCSSCGVSLSETPGIITLHYMFYTGAISCFGPETPPVVNVQEWCQAQLATRNVVPARHNCDREAFPSATQIFNLNHEAPPVLVFHTFPTTFMRLQPSESLSLPLSSIAGQQPVLTYRLFAVTYYGNSHFTARILLGEQWWNYDGMAPSPTRFACGDTENLMESLTNMNDSIATHFLYTICPGTMLDTLL
jgi:hypothetical protein